MGRRNKQENKQQYDKNSKQINTIKWKQKQSTRTDKSTNQTNQPNKKQQQQKRLAVPVEAGKCEAFKESSNNWK